MSAQTQKASKPATPGPLARKASQLAERFVRAAWPYLAACAVAAVLAFITKQYWLVVLVTGAAGWHALLRLHEAYGWHRKGGRAAARKRSKYQGPASRRERRAKLSAHAIRKRAHITRPATDCPHKLPAAELGVLIGRTLRRPRQQLFGSHEDTVVVYAGPRTGKTSWMSGVVLDAPGFVLSTSTRPDIWGHTAIARSRRGPVLTLDPDPFSGIGSSLAWDMLDGCVLPGIAIERAGYLMNSGPKNATGDHAWWDHQSAEYLRGLLHAGELCGANLLDVRAWARDPASKEPASVLYDSQFAAPGWADELAALAGQDPEYQQSVARGVLTALSWLADPAMAAIACPPPEKSLDAWQLLEENGAIYLISANKPHGSIAAFNACLTSHIWETGKRKAAISPGFRLDPAALFVIDEPTITCPLPLDKMFPEAGGWGMPIVTGVQSPAQLVRQWGPEGARIIRDCATIELVFGGNTDDRELESVSAICGYQDSWEKAPQGKPTSHRVHLYPPERIRTLKEGHAIVLHRSARPVEAEVSRVWDRPDYEAAEIVPAAPPGPVWPDGTPVIIGTTETPEVTGAQGYAHSIERN